jgi:hypothetical protein
MASTAICLCSDSSTCLSPSLLQHRHKACNTPRSIPPPPHCRASALIGEVAWRGPLPAGAEEATDRFLLSGQCGSGPGANKKKVGCLLQWGVCLISRSQNCASSPNRRRSASQISRQTVVTNYERQASRGRLLAIRFSLHCSSPTSLPLYFRSSSAHRRSI